MGNALCCGQRVKFIEPETTDPKENEVFADLYKTRNKNNSDVEITPEQAEQKKPIKQSSDEKQKSNAAEHLKYNPRNSDLYDDGVSIWKRYMSGSQSSMHGSDMKQNQKANLKESPINDKTK